MAKTKLTTEDTPTSAKVKVDEFKNVIEKKQEKLRLYLKQKDYAIKLRQTKVNNWIKNEELYNGVTQRTLLTRSNIHVPIVYEGVQTMSAKVGTIPDLDYDIIPEGNEIASELMKHVIKEDLDQSNWDLIYENSKTECGIYGRTVYKVIPGNDKQTVELVDTLAFLISPIAKDTKSSLYCGQQFIYKTLAELKEEADSMEYDTEELHKLEIQKVPSEDQTDSTTEASLRNIRTSNMGLANVNQYGSKVAEITEWWTYLMEDGKPELYCLTVANDMYLLRCKKASELGLERMPFVSWGTYTRGITFWCPSVADIYRDPNLAVNVLTNQIIDNNTYRNFGQMMVSSSSGLKQSSIVPRPLGITNVTCAPGEKVQDKVWQFVPESIGDTPNTIQSIKSFADSASGLNYPAPRGKQSATKQAQLQAEIESRISLMKRNATLACQELYQLMADIAAKKMTKPRKVKIFGYKDLTIEDVTKKNFDDVELRAKASPSEDSAANKAIKQKAKIELYQLFKDDPKIPGQLSLRRSVAKTFDISPDEIESWFRTEEQQGNPTSQLGGQPQTSPEAPQGSPQVSKPMGEATALLGQTQQGAQANVPPSIK